MAQIQKPVQLVVQRAVVRAEAFAEPRAGKCADADGCAELRADTGAELYGSGLISEGYIWRVTDLAAA